MNAQGEFHLNFTISTPIQLEINKNGNLMMCRACIMKMAEMNGVEKEKLEKIGEALSKCEDIKNADS